VSTAPKFPPPTPGDSPEVATLLRNAAALWSKDRHREALPLLVRAANAAKTRSEAPASDLRVVTLALAATELAAYVDAGEDPRSIPISLEFNTDSIDINSIDVTSAESSVLHISVDPPRPMSTLREEQRPAAPRPNAPAAPRPPPRIDLTQTMSQDPRPPQPAAPPLNIRVIQPAGVPTPNTLREAPTTEPSERASAVPTKRMEDVPTRRAPDIDPAAPAPPADPGAPGPKKS
jgi:hypothetical protein